MAKRGTITAWLRRRISHLDYGLKWRGGVIHCNKNEDVLGHLQNKRKLSHLKNDMLARHFADEDTFYFAGNSWDDETLVMIDIDCHDGIGSLQGAMAYAQFLRDTFFPNLYFEPSTNGRGVHGYFVLVKGRVSPKDVNHLLGRLQAFLRETTNGFDIQTVEIKGRCPVVVWSKKRGQVANYKAGTLAKLPRQSDRFEELKNTTRLTVSDLLAIMVKPVQSGATRTTTRKTQARKKAVPKASLPMARTEVQKKNKPIGSCSDRLFSETELGKLNGHYLKVAETLLGTHPIKTGRVVATQTDLAIFLMLLRFFSTHMNEDGSLPWARFKSLWDALFKAGDISRAFEPKRFAALRNYLSSLGLIDWQDNTYHLGSPMSPGKACKWKASEKLMEMLECEEEKKKESKRTSLAGTKPPFDLQKTVESLTMVPFEDTIRPIWTIPMPFQIPMTEELEKRLGWAA